MSIAVAGPTYQRDHTAAPAPSEVSSAAGDRQRDFGSWVRNTRLSIRPTPTMTECADRAGITPQRWWMIEHGGKRNKAQRPAQVSRGTAKMVARALGVPEGEALEAAGYRPERRRPDTSSLIAEIYDALSPEKQAELESIARALRARDIRSS